MSSFGSLELYLSVCRLVFSQRLEETSLQISGKFSLHSSHLSGTLPRTFQLPQLPQAPLLVSSTQSVSQFLFGCLSQCQSPEISSRQKTRTIIGGRLTLFISLLSEITVLLCLLLIVSYILSSFLVISSRRVCPVPLTDPQLDVTICTLSFGGFLLVPLVRLSSATISLGNLWDFHHFDLSTPSFAYLCTPRPATPNYPRTVSILGHGLQ